MSRRLNSVARGRELTAATRPTLWRGPSMNNGALERSLRPATHGAPAAREAGGLASRCNPPARHRPADSALSSRPAPSCDHRGAAHVARSGAPFADACDEEDAERERDPSTDPAPLKDRTMETYQAMEEKDAAARQRRRRPERD